MSKTSQVYDGEQIDVTDGLYDICCDCGLAHRVYYEILHGRILRKVYVDKRKTYGHRKTKDIKAKIITLVKEKNYV